MASEASSTQCLRTSETPRVFRILNLSSVDSTQDGPANSGRPFRFLLKIPFPQGGGAEDDADGGVACRGNRGRHRRAAHRILRFRSECLGQTEVQHLDRAFRWDLDVRRLEIALDDTPFVRRLKRARDRRPTENRQDR